MLGLLAMSLTAKAQTSISLVEGNVVLRFPTASNLLYSVQWSDLPASNSWSTIASNIVGSGGALTSMDPGAATAAARFYRVGSFNPSTNGGTVAVLVEFNGGAPVQNALIVLSDSGNGGYGYSDGNGQIIFANVPDGSFSIQAYSPDDGAPSTEATGTISATGSISSVSVTMPGSGSVTVWVDYASGDPAQGATIDVISGTTTNKGAADSTGNDTFEGIPVGSFTVTAVNPTNATSTATASGNLATNGASATLYLTLP
jgi:hypothetical protein